MRDETNETLMMSYRDGDVRAFELLLSRHQRPIYEFILRSVGPHNTGLAEDLAQETFLRAYEQLGTFRGTAKFSTWLYRIAVNTCLNWRQSETRRFRLHADCTGEMSTLHGHDGPAASGN